MEKVVITLETSEQMLTFVLDTFVAKLAARGMEEAEAKRARDTMDACLWATVSSSDLDQIDVVQCLSASFNDLATLLALSKFSNA